MVSELTSAPIPPLRADDHVRGPADASLAIVYGDLTCAQCALAAQSLRTAPVRVAFRHLALARRHRRAVPVAIAAEAAARQGAFWDFHDVLMADQGRLDDPYLWARCEVLGLDVERFESDRRDPSLAARVARDTRDALRGGAVTTPTLVLPDGTLHPGAPDPTLLARIAMA